MPLRLRARAVRQPPCPACAQPLRPAAQPGSAPSEQAAAQARRQRAVKRHQPHAALLPLQARRCAQLAALLPVRRPRRVPPRARASRQSCTPSERRQEARPAAARAATAAHRHRHSAARQHRPASQQRSREVASEARPRRSQRQPACCCAARASPALAHGTAHGRLRAAQPALAAAAEAAERQLSRPHAAEALPALLCAAHH